MNPGRTPAWIGSGHSLDKMTDFTTDLRSSRAFGFEFPEKLKTLSVPADNGIRLDNDERLAPRSPNSGNQNPEEPIHHSNLRPLVRPFHHDQLLAKRKVFGSEIRSDFELRPYEQNKISKRFHHHYSLAGTQKFVNNYMKYELLRRTVDLFVRQNDLKISGIESAPKTPPSFLGNTRISRCYAPVHSVRCRLLARL